MSMMVAMVPTANIGEVLYIPTDGVLQVFAYGVEPISLLTNPGKYVCVHVGSRVHLHFRATDDGPPNPRAAAVLARLTDVHMGFTGPVIFDGLPGELIFDIIQTLSKEGA